MRSSAVPGNNSRPLENVGISELEEQIYRWLLQHSGETASKVGQALHVSPGEARNVLETLEAKGLVTHIPDRPFRYISASPDMALRALILQRQKGLEEAEIVVDELQKYKTSKHKNVQEQVVELITSTELERQVFDQLSRTVQHEVMALQKPPVRVSRLDIPSSEDCAVQFEAKKRGVRRRGIVDTEFMALNGIVNRLREEIRSGEEVRVFPELPFKMIVFDREVALIPLHLRPSNGPSLLVKSSALLDALCLLFRFLWERSTPIHLSDASILRSLTNDSKLSDQARELISLMASGLNDKSIFWESGISRSTHQKHVSELMQALNARTRFQAGWLAALQLFSEGSISIESPENKAHLRDGK